MKFYDLFAGIGGFRLGLERNGFECVGSCEIDKYARQIYQKQFGELPDNDARELVPSNMPDFDILTAGFPCQAFSVAGQRLGFNDTRGTLFFEIARIAREARPSILFLENVKGLLSNDRGRTFGTILNTLYELGYDVEWQIINGKSFVPQNRERIFIIGHLREKPTPQIFPLTDFDKVDAGTRQETQGEGKRVRSALVRAITHCYYKGSGSRTMIMLSHTKGNVKQRIQNRNNTWTLDTSGNRMAIDDEKNIRRLTPLECERLMGFPDNWTEGLSDTQRYKVIGNAVIVPIVEYISRYFEIQKNI